MATPAVFDKLLLIARIAALRGHERWSPARLERHRRDAIARLQRFALVKSPYYRSAFRGLENAPLEQWPTLPKTKLIEAFDEIVTDRRVRLHDVQTFAQTMSATDRYLGTYDVVATSGTTGARAYFLFDRAEWRSAIAGLGRTQAWQGSTPGGRQRAAFMATTVPWHMTARGSAELRRLGLNAGGLTLDAAEPLAAIVAKLNAYKPEKIVGYPSLLQLLAAEQRAGRLVIAPDYIQCTSEVLTETARAEISSAFGAKLSNLYAASECGCVAATCRKDDGLHIPQDLCHLEIVDEKNRPVPAGEEGAKALLTVFASRTMPLIRYELSDRLTLATEPCTCGMPFARLKAVSGRTADMLILKGVSGGEVQIAWAQISACLRDLPVTGWQMSVAPDEIVISCVVTGQQFDEREIVSRITALFESKGAVAPRMRARRVDALERGPTGKAKLITQKAA